MTDIVERLRAWCIDWNGAQMVDGEPPRDGLHCDELREAAAEIERLRAESDKLLRYQAMTHDIAVRAEREACAMIALADDSFMMLQDFGMQQTCTTVRENIAAAIRARGDATDQPPSLPRQD